MNRLFIFILACALAAGGCSGPKSKGGGYYKDDGPGDRIPANIEAIPNAVPRLESHRPANARPYVVLGKRYVPISAERAFRQVGTASWYGRKFHGKKTANGETYDMYAMTAAHPTLPLPSYARVTHARSGKSIIVRINDRGPFHSSRIIDLSYVAAAKLGLIGPGSGQVIVEAITNSDIRNNTFQRNNDTAPAPMPIPDAKPAPSPMLITQAPADEMTGSGASPTPDALMALNSSVETSGEGSDRAAMQPRMTATAQYVALRPASANATASPAVSHGSPQVFLQFGAFSTHDNANRLADKINHQIAQLESRRATVTQSSDLHRVHVGPYSSRTEAVNAALRIRSATGLEASYWEDATSDRSSASL